MIDRQLYLPRTTWCDDPARRAVAGIPYDVAFASKAELAAAMVHAALDAGARPLSKRR